MWRRLISSAIFVLTATCLVQEAIAARTVSARRDQRISTVLEWLPPDTESIAVLQRPVTYDVNSDQPIDAESVYQSPFVFSILINSNAKEIPEGDELKIVPDISLSVQCAGRWTQLPHQNVGGRTLAYITFLTPDAVRDRVLQQRYRKNAHSIFVDCDQTVFELVLPDSDENKKQHDRIEPIIYKSIPKPGLLIITNDRSLMHSILSRMDRKNSGARALPANLPEWHEVNMRARYWGLRHFQSDDPTSPRSSSAYIKQLYRKPDERAIGLTFEYSPKSGTLELNYMSSNPNLKSVVEAVVHRDGFGKWGRTAITRTKPNVVLMKVFTEGNESNGALYCVHPWVGAPMPWPG